MAMMYVCPVCTHSSNLPFPLPPVRRVGTCKKCGSRVVRTVKSIAQAWGLFFFLGIWLLLWHCGNVFTAALGGATQVRCPRCKAGLGTVAR